MILELFSSSSLNDGDGGCGNLDGGRCKGRVSSTKDLVGRWFDILVDLFEDSDDSLRMKFISFVGKGCRFIYT